MYVQEFISLYCCLVLTTQCQEFLCIQQDRMDVRGKVSIITGSAQGLGKAFAARLLEAGGNVCISDVNQAKGEAALAELRERFGKDR